LTDGLDRLRSTAQSRGAEKKNEKIAKPAIDPQVLKWLLYGTLASLFAVGVYVMFENASSSGGEDPALKMKRSMGIVEDGSSAPQGPAVSSWDEGMQMVASSDPQTRVNGMTLLMNTDANRAAPIVQGLVADEAPLVRTNAATLLAEHNIQGSGVILVPLLSDPDPAVSGAAVAALTKFAGEAGLIYQLATPLNSPDPTVVVNTLKVLKAAAAYDRDAVSGALSGPLNSNDDAVLTAALDAAWHLTQDQLRTYRPTIEAVKARKAGTPIEPLADALIQEIDRAIKYQGQ
jgi:HEAT repeat protein